MQEEGAYRVALSPEYLVDNHLKDYNLNKMKSVAPLIFGLVGAFSLLLLVVFIVCICVKRRSNAPAVVDVGAAGSIEIPTRDITVREGMDYKFVAVPKSYKPFSPTATDLEESPNHDG